MASDTSSSPPTKASLRAWWNHFTFAQKVKKEAAEKADQPEHTVFGKPLKESLHYASVQISTANANGELYVWGYIPVVVAKCGLFLKEKATEVEGVFRVNGSNKRMRELQAIFETAPRYGKSIDWKETPYTAHDVASVFRRYLTQMPEPVIPYDLYHDFREAMSREQSTQEELISTFKRLIREMPRPNQYLLLYVLDLLSVFARKSDKNLMTATNLAVIFRPGLISHPNHEMSPAEHHLSQRVLEFLIAQQDWFMLDIPPPPQDEFAQTGSNSRGGGTINQPRSPDSDDVTVFPSSDEEQSTGGGWKLVSSRVARRKTTIDRQTPTKAEHDPDLSPVNEHPEHQGATGVSRSRTLPSGRRGASGSASSNTGGERDRDTPRLLKKQKRASSSQPLRTKLVPELSSKEV